MRRVGPTAVVGLLVLGGLLGVLTLSSRVATANTLYVGGGGPGNYTSIQAAVNAAFPGDTVFVYSGNYTENVTVTKTLNLVGEGMETTFLHGAGAYYTLNVGADWVNVTGLSVVGGVAYETVFGIGMSGHHNRIFRNNASIRFDATLWAYTTITDNVIHRISRESSAFVHPGLQVRSSSFVTIDANTFPDSGIDLWDSTDVTITANNFTSVADVSAGVGFGPLSQWVHGSLANHNSHTITPDNLVNGKPLYYHKNCSGLTVDGVPLGQLIVVNCTAVQISHLQLANPAPPIYVAYSNGVNISTSNVASYILSLQSSDLSIVSNTVGFISLWYTTNARLIANYIDFGTDVAISSSVVISGNIIYDGSVRLHWCNDIQVTDNHITSSDFAAIEVGGPGPWGYRTCSNVVILRNTLESNYVIYYIISVTLGSSILTVHHNNIGTTQGGGYGTVSDEGSGTTWDDGYPSGGNHWWDYTGVDLLSGPNQDLPGTDGIGDTPYVIDSDSIDRYPLMSPMVPGTMPVLSATGEPNYGTDGVDPETGTLGATFTYRVSYLDADNDFPLAGDPKVHIRKGSVEIAGSPFTMTAVDPLDADVTDGKLYTYTTTLTSRGTDYTYEFTASDAVGLAAADWPAPPADAPDVLNRPPTADAGPDQNVPKGTLVTLDGALSRDPDNDPLSYTWAAPPGIALSSANVPMPTFTATRTGTFPFTLTVDDGDPANGTDTDTVVITVWGLPPVANLTADRMRANVGGAFLFSGAGSTDADGSIAAYLFEFADGTDQTGGSDTAMHAYAAPGSYVVRLTVWDDDGNASAADTLTVTVNAPPVASGTVTPASGTLATTFTFTSTSTDSDGTIVTTSWDFGDGATDSGTTVTHAYATRQTFAVTLTVWDDDGATATSTLSVSVGNLPPTAAFAVTPASGDVATEFTFDGSASTDDGTIVAYAWDFGDGTTGSGVVVTHRYSRNGSFAVTLTVTDDGGLEGNATASVAVSRAPGLDDGTVIGIIGIIIGAIIVALWRLRVLWFPYFILWCYTKLRKDEVLDNFLRGRIYEYVRLNPGDAYTEIKRNLDLSNGPLLYHLAVLEREELVRSIQQGSRKRFYPNDVAVPEDGGLHALQARILEALRGEPGVAVTELAMALGVSRHVALYHIRKLVRSDLVRLERRMARLRAYPVRPSSR